MLVIVIKATDEDFDDQISGHSLGFNKWRDDVYELFGVNKKKSNHIPTLLFKLKRIRSYEQTSDFHGQIKPVFESGRSYRVIQYVASSGIIPLETSLLRKTSSVSSNLIDLISQHNGCASDEISKIDRLSKLFVNHSRISLTFSRVKDKTLSFCLSTCKQMLMLLLKLIGKQNFDTVVKLTQFLNWNSWADNRIGNVYNQSVALIDLVAKGVASYLNTIEHPDLENIAATNSTPIESIIGDLYQIEVLNPATVFCMVLNPIRQKLPVLRGMNPKTPPTKGIRYEKLIDSSCNLASFGFDKLRSRMLYHLLKIRKNQIT